jgi:hypothetical protein
VLELFTRFLSVVLTNIVSSGSSVCFHVHQLIN